MCGNSKAPTLQSQNCRTGPKMFYITTYIYISLLISSCYLANCFSLLATCSLFVFCVRYALGSHEPYESRGTGDLALGWGLSALLDLTLQVFMPLVACRQYDSCGICEAVAYVFC